MLPYLFTLLSVAGLLVAHLFGTHGLYVHFPPYDIFMHTLGGFSLGLFVNALIGPKRGTIILWVFIAGVVWELFEAYYNIAGYDVGTKLYYIDTAKDLIDDILGAIIAAVTCANIARRRVSEASNTPEDHTK